MVTLYSAKFSACKVVVVSVSVLRDTKNMKIPLDGMIIQNKLGMQKTYSNYWHLSVSLVCIVLILLTNNLLPLL
jgi:hypothetical protein